MITANEFLEIYANAARVLTALGTHALTSVVSLFGLWLSAAS